MHKPDKKNCKKTVKNDNCNNNIKKREKYMQQREKKEKKKQQKKILLEKIPQWPKNIIAQKKKVKKERQE